MTEWLLEHVVSQFLAAITFGPFFAVGLALLPFYSLCQSGYRWIWGVALVTVVIIHYMKPALGVPHKILAGLLMAYVVMASILIRVYVKTKHLPPLSSADRQNNSTEHKSNRRE